MAQRTVTQIKDHILELKEAGAPKSEILKAKRELQKKKAGMPNVVPPEPK
jgi:hypothetical protein